MFEELSIDPDLDAVLQAVGINRQGDFLLRPAHGAGQHEARQNPWRSETERWAQHSNRITSGKPSGKRGELRWRPLKAEAPT